MSLSTSILPFSLLPSFFTQKFILEIQTHIQTKQQFTQLLQNYTNQTLDGNKNLPIVKQQFFKKLIKKSYVRQAVINLYKQLTKNQYTIEEKHHVVNLLYKLIYLVSQLGMNKEKWRSVLEEETVRLAKRFCFEEKKSANSQVATSYTAPILSIYQAEQLLEYFRKNIVPFYQIWQKLLDQNQDVTVKSKFYQPIQQKQNKIPSLSQGKKLQIAQFLSLQILKPYISDKPPVQQKKDPKKK